jgi:hypothetical protein
MSYSDIEATLKFLQGNNIFLASYFLMGNGLVLRSRHLVLWSLETLTGQQRSYGSGLVTQKRRYYHPLNVLPEADCIANFVLNC